jgi:hypothetical protein
MAAVIYARECRSGAWADATEESVPSLVVAELVNRSENCSVWKVENSSSANLILIAAALAIREEKVVPIAFRFISNYYIQKNTLSISQTPAETVDSALNGTNTHYELELKTADQAAAAAKGFIAREKKESDLTVFGEKEILAQIGLSVRTGRVRARALSHALLTRLIDEEYLPLT